MLSREESKQFSAWMTKIHASSDDSIEFVKNICNSHIQRETPDKHFYLLMNGMADLLAKSNEKSDLRQSLEAYWKLLTSLKSSFFCDFRDQVIFHFATALAIHVTTKKSDDDPLENSNVLAPPSTPLFLETEQEAVARVDFYDDSNVLERKPILFPVSPGPAELNEERASPQPAAGSELPDAISPLNFFQMKQDTSNPYKWKCTLCPKVLRTRNLLRRHQRLAHVAARKTANRASTGKLPTERKKNIRGCKCCDCGKYFRSPSVLAKHKQTQHEAAITRACESCARTYMTVAARISHEKSCKKKLEQCPPLENGNLIVVPTADGQTRN